MAFALVDRPEVHVPVNVAVTLNFAGTLFFVASGMRWRAGHGYLSTRQYERHRSRVHNAMATQVASLRPTRGLGDHAIHTCSFRPRSTDTPDRICCALFKGTRTHAETVRQRV